MRQSILVTGSAGLIGTALVHTLSEAGFEAVPLDLRAPLGRGCADVRDPAAIRAALAPCAGVVHLAAVSRVIWGERDPHGCWETNVGGTRNVLAAALEAPLRPWVLFASSREVYGQPDRLPVTEDAPLAPLNVYGGSKVMGERLVGNARAAGLRGAVVRLSNVYGSAADHPDRVVPAFARSALRGVPLRVDGAGNTFDFTHLDDTTRGLLALVQALESGEAALPPIHLVTGVPTTLGALASLAVSLAGTTADALEAPPRSFDVARFYGHPGRAKEVLGWEPQVALRDGLARLIEELRAESAAPQRPSSSGPARPGTSS
ncbi:NAD-dependent epimerase/dehydratase family protein [Chondromyces apiculatus]|uniref:UDP-glucose 4-epimerase n=1 Tax=Chondromyces apiculatus DSM 436 TaxID=1192034 RepID=A0A017SW32_9BACT|nr:NAD-dependent epimerase/dehydratase family protein [Chondromyces apiculatus]EYF00501.1 UDP-glucose 4-epimerase [Chondromyces apiculatus DSM 436]